MATAKSTGARKRAAKKPPPPEGKWRTRIVGTGTEVPDQLLANPQNWRIHPQEQQQALAAALERVGWVQNIVVNRQTGHVVDGHLRVGLAISQGEPQVPVVYVDLTVEEESLVLATLDPLASMAVTDEGALKGLLSGLDASGPLGDLLDVLAGNDALDAVRTPSQDQLDRRQEQLDGQMQGRGPELVDVTCPECGHDFAIGGTGT